MTYFTVMLITALSGPLADADMRLVYFSQDKCLLALNSVSNTLGYDHKIECIVTQVASSSIRPRARPTQ